MKDCTGKRTEKCIIYYYNNYSAGKGESRGLLKKAIAMHIGDAEEAERLIRTLVTGIYGKPRIPGFCGFSVTHSEHTWAVLICGAECGLDIQYPRRIVADRIAARFFTPEEQQVVANSGAAGNPEFFRIWARREALIKALGRSVADTDLPSAAADTAEYAGRRYHITDIEVPGAEKAAAAVCICAGGSRSGACYMIEVCEMI